MARDFGAVFACVRIGGTEDAHQYFIDNLWSIFDMSVVDGIGLGLGEILREDMGKNFKRLRA